MASLSISPFFYELDIRSIEVLSSSLGGRDVDFFGTSDFTFRIWVDAFFVGGTFTADEETSSSCPFLRS